MTVTVTTSLPTTTVTTEAVVTVPLVVGLTEPLAVSKIEASGLGVQVRRVHAAGPKDTVTAQSPPAGSQTTKGFVVKINVSTGK